MHAVVVVCLAGLADGAGDAEAALELVAGVAEAGLQQRPAGVRPAVCLAHPARDVVRAVALTTCWLAPQGGTPRTRFVLKIQMKNEYYKTVRSSEPQSSLLAVNFVCARPARRVRSEELPTVRRRDGKTARW